MKELMIDKWCVAWRERDEGILDLWSISTYTLCEVLSDKLTEKSSSF